MSLFEGILTGLVLALSTGPVFFTLLHTSMHKGFRKSLYFIVGTSFTDLSIILICWFGLNQIEAEFDATWMSNVAGIVLILFGLSFLIKKSTTVKNDSETSENSNLDNWSLFLKAMLLGSINPIVWVLWAAVSEYSIANFDGNSVQLMYFGGVLLSIFTTDLLKSYFAERLKSFLSDKYLQYINYVIGVLMIGFGVKMLIG